MEKETCPALANGKPCDLELILVECDTDTGTEIYECSLGHRKYVVLGERQKRKCRALVDGKECALALSLVQKEVETATEIYECPLGHRSYVPLGPEVTDDSA
jgi:hypothetical protein